MQVFCSVLLAPAPDSSGSCFRSVPTLKNHFKAMMSSSFNSSAPSHTGYRARSLFLGHRSCLLHFSVLLLRFLANEKKSYQKFSLGKTFNREIAIKIPQQSGSGGTRRMRSYFPSPLLLHLNRGAACFGIPPHQQHKRSSMQLPPMLEGQDSHSRAFPGKGRAPFSEPSLASVASSHLQHGFNLQ